MKINYDLIGRSLIHPVQLKILEMFAEQPGQCSAKEAARYIDYPLATVSYHFRLLAGLPASNRESPYAAKPLLREVDTKQCRGALAHFYALTEEATTDARS